MVNKNFGHSILEYLQKNGATNTFKLAHVLGIKRDKLLGILKNLEEQELVKIVTGKVKFLSYPISKEKKKKPRVVVQKEKPKVQVPKEELEKQKLYIEKLKAQIKKLEQKPSIEPIVEKVKIEKVKPKPRKEKELLKVKPEKRKIKLTKKKPLPKRKKLKKTKKIKLKLPKLKMSKMEELKIRGELGLLKIKEFIKNLKRR